MTIKIRYFLIVLYTIILNKMFTLAALNCLPECKCSWISHNLAADCSNLNLKKYPEITDDIPIESFNFFNNNFNNFPYYLSKLDQLTHLDLTKNQIEYLEENSLSGFNSLKTLILNNNSFSNWQNINPNNAIKDAITLETLSLAGNNIQSFSNPDETYILISHSLILLDLSDNNISKISGKYILSGMRSLERLILNGNPLRILTSIESNSLKVLDLSNCNLIQIQSNSFDYLKNLISLDLSKNPNINLITNNVDVQHDDDNENVKVDANVDNYPKSKSLKRLILSYCNLYSINILNGFPNLITLIFRGNLLKKINSNDFIHLNYLEYLDLSENVINVIDSNAFENLKLLKKLDLSYNTILTIHSTTFINNVMLTGLNLSRNYINRFSKIISKSLVALNLSWCEVLKIDRNALEELDSLKILDLSNNLISDFPIGLKSDHLEDLDMSMCRLSSIKNTTFELFPQLIKLKLSGNRFTTPFHQSYFSTNQYLQEIWLGDNPWMCFCDNSQFIDFYIFLTQREKIKDKNHLRCGSPQEFYGKTWERSCYSVWYPNAKMGTAERSWTIIMMIIIFASMSFCIFSGGRKLLKKFRDDRNEREYRANQDERDELRRQNLIHLQQQAQLNAPDARESNPPCYEEAVLLPKLERSFKSMDELCTKRKSKNRNKSSVEENADDDIIDGSIVDRHRFLSEERLSNRDKERTQMINTDRNFHRPGKIPRTISGSRLYYANDNNRFPAAHLKSQNLSSAEHIATLKNYRASPYSERKWKMHMDSISFASISDEEIGCHRTSINKNDFEMLTNKKISPYSRRRPRGLSVSQLSISNDKIDHDTQIPCEQEETDLDIHSDYFNKNDCENNSLISKENSSEFEMMADPDANAANAVSVDCVVVVHHPMKESKI